MAYVVGSIQLGALMSKKDVIIISALINTGLLAVLFVTALKTNPEVIAEVLKVESPSYVTITNLEREIALNETKEASHVDEVDMVLKEYLPEVVVNDVVAAPLPPPPPPQEVKVEAATVAPAPSAVVEVVVKSGDVLERIARANRTTVEAIKKANGLSSDRLKVGQVLKIPVGAMEKEVKKAAQPIAESEGPTFYVIKPGDNPWKIAKNHQVKFEDLLILNHLDEDRAKNLKVGEKIRVR